ncbi:pyruvate kinase [Caldicellulosiruptor hydrothermalis 108]|uniref:Pyruvate kinase n=1 Tax=Caldicellulosiruptor hydrothermalis (strain DSM 18901 / VKM B-2411 / 108) TaxID=632292 RepID=E4QB84_CALH1|nr:pyruvate kinase [Caldicellulosiruptor hydrothermalis]ADQ07177.1 pyruvate kinase [Caldicellulosiruptor hydrothermalis 108]
MRKTKIICTLGPATDSEEIIRKLVENGMDVVRLNFSHGTHEEHKKKIDMVKKIREELDKPIPILLDTKGPEIRIGFFKDGKVELKEGQKFVLTVEEILGNEEIVSITYKELVEDVKPGDKILIDDGLIELIVEDKTEKDIICKVKNGGVLTNQKGVNVPGIPIRLPALTQKDKEDILFGIENDVDFIAASFIRKASDVVEIREFLNKNGGKDILIIAKIETQEGVANCDEIIRVADGIMVARGDLGVELPFEEVPLVQKMLIEKCYKAGKPVITATQMLESMIRNPRPTRAEVSDIANAIFDGTSAIMLSGETAMGKYPVESVATMAKIAERVENQIDYIKRFQSQVFDMPVNVTNAISHATCTTAHDLGAKAIITVTKSGNTARMVSKFRPACPIIATTPCEKVRRQLNLSWGVYPFLAEYKSSTDDIFDNAVEIAVKSKIVKNGDLVVITAGVPVGVSGTTNILKVHVVGHVLVEGRGWGSGKVTSRVCVVKNINELKQNFEDGDIIVTSQTNNEFIPYMKRALGIITEEGGQNSHAVIVGAALDIPVITDAKNALEILKTGIVVTIDTQKGIVFSGEQKTEE